MGRVNRLPRLELVTTRRQEQIVELCVMLKNRIRNGRATLKKRTWTCRAVLNNRMNIGSVGRHGMGWDGIGGDGMGWEERMRGCMRVGAVTLLTLCQSHADWISFIRFQFHRLRIHKVFRF